MTQYPTATFRDGQLVPDGPIQLTEGERYVMVPANQQALDSLAIHYDPVWDDPTAIQARLDRLDAIEPLEMTPEEIRDWEEYREKVKRYTIEAMLKQTDNLP